MEKDKEEGSRRSRSEEVNELKFHLNKSITIKELHVYIPWIIKGISWVICSLRVIWTLWLVISRRYKSSTWLSSRFVRLRVGGWAVIHQYTSLFLSDTPTSVSNKDHNISCTHESREWKEVSNIKRKRKHCNGLPAQQQTPWDHNQGQRICHPPHHLQIQVRPTGNQRYFKYSHAEYKIQAKCVEIRDK